MSSDITLEQLTETAESAQLILENVTMLNELSSQLKQETKNGEHYLNSLNNLLFQAGKDVSSLHQCVDSLLLVARKLVYLSLQIVPTNNPNFKSLETEAEKLLIVLDEIRNDEEGLTKWREMDKSLKGNLSSKSLIVDEKYPDHCSKESLLEMSNVIVLPTVHEDVFTDFCRQNRTPSSSSLKNLRKVKLCLQKVYDEDNAEITEERTNKECKNPCSKETCECSLQVKTSLEPTTTTNLAHIQEEENLEKSI